MPSLRIFCFNDSTVDPLVEQKSCGFSLKTPRIV